ncbi:hypothetical protein [Nocardia thailandica]|uniref:hypothetical protein n=1 Tax=Nocardia thailandica TaxID=257275 RepID=UPI0002F18C92|nr:hypothetical protein [Nocardia thailandica]
MPEQRGEKRNTVAAGAALGALCAVTAIAVAAFWWWQGPSTVSCYYASYEPADGAFGDMASRMWPTRWFWAGLVVVPVVTGAIAGWIAAMFGVRVSRRSRTA